MGGGDILAPEKMSSLTDRDNESRTNKGRWIIVPMMNPFLYASQENLKTPNATSLTNLGLLMKSKITPGKKISI